MSTSDNRIVYAENKLPVSVRDFCNILSCEWRLFQVNPDVLITDIVVADNASVSNGCLFVPYEESDKVCSDSREACTNCRKSMYGSDDG